jgi:hypothetical protein
MKKIFAITILTLLFAGISAIPSMAVSSLADDFIKACYRLDAPFPPSNWEKSDLRVAAIEVLDLVNAGQVDESLGSFCLKAIGYAGNPDDLPLILSYKDDMPSTVLRSLQGFAHPDAIKFLIGKLNSKEINTRELASQSLGAMDFSKMEKPMKWYSTVESALKGAYDREKEQWLKDDLLDVMKNLKKPSIETIE